MTATQIVAYHDRLSAPIVQFWNQTFGEARNALPMTGQLFRQRIVEVDNFLGRFEPDDLLLAVEDRAVVGLAHVGVRSEALCSLMFSDWPGGDQGYVALIVVRPDRRGGGIGTALMDAALERLRPCAQTVVDGQCFNPFYGNCAAPFTPLWGTSEGISVERDDADTRRFFSRFGFEPRFEAVTLQLRLGDRAPAQATLPEPYALQLDNNHQPILGAPLDELMPLPECNRCTSALAVYESTIVGYITTYPLWELAADRQAIYQMEILQKHRDKGLGRALLEGALESMAAAGGAHCEVLTLPEESPGAYALYHKMGFTDTVRWAIY